MPLKDGAINQILPFANEGVEAAGDIMPLEEYKKHAMRMRGHMVGIALRELQNRQARQAMHMAAGSAQFLANRYVSGVKDDGDLDKVEEAWRVVIQAMIDEGLPNPLPIENGGTGAKDVNWARDNLSVNRFEQTADHTAVFSPNGEIGFFVHDDGLHGAWDVKNKRDIPLPLSRGGTGSTTVEGARETLRVNRFEQTADHTAVFSPNGEVGFFVHNDGLHGAWDVKNKRDIPLPLSRGGTGASDAYSARTNLGAPATPQNGEGPGHFTLVWDMLPKIPDGGTWVVWGHYGQIGGPIFGGVWPGGSANPGYKQVNTFGFAWRIM